MKVGEALRHGIAVLAAAGVDNPAFDARMLLGHAMGVDQAALLRDRQVVAPATYQALLTRRVAREPVAFITGLQEFWSLEFAVSAATLIPRADSETLLEALIAARPDRGAVRRILDLGTGTGCLLLAALTEYPAAWGVGIDLLPESAALARGNAERLGLGERASFLAGDWAGALSARFDVVLSNPPYIPADEIAALMPEVARFESRLALDGGWDGFAAYRALLQVLPGLLKRDGIAVLELGAGQAAVVCELAGGAGFRTAIRRDYGGVDRALVLEVEKKVGNREGTD